jgi:hypothetical protein
MVARPIPLCWLFCCAAALSACGSPKYEWSQATTINTVAGYQTFLSKYPNDPRAADARSRIAALQDEQAWSAAQVASTAQGYQQYLADEPNGAHAQAARDEAASRERAAAWQSLQTDETAQSLRAFLDKYPAGPEAEHARDKLRMLAGYRAELGIAHNQKTAERERAALAKRFGKNIPQVVVLKPDADSRDYRLASAPMSEQDANAACASVKHAGQSCKVIQVIG